MQITLTHPSDTQAKLKVVANEAELAVLKETVLTRFQKEVKIQGFRQGKAPLPLVEKNIAPAAFQNEFLDEAINQMYVQAVNDKKLRIVNNPQISLTKWVPFTELEFDAEVEVVGEVKLPDYKKIKLAKEAVKVTADDVKAVVKQLQQRAAERKDVDRAAKSGDQTYIDFKGVDAKGEPVNGAEGKDYPLILGSNSFIPGFEDNVVGMKAGEEKTFTLTFPKDYGVKALANKKVTFTVNLTKVQEIVEPNADDAFAATVGPFKSMDELKTDIKKQLEAERQNEVDRKFENDLIEEIAKKVKVSIPKSMVDNQISRMESDEKQNLIYRGQTWEEHLKEEGVTEEEHHEQKREQAEAQVRAGLALAEIAEAEEVRVSDDELDVRMQLLRGQYSDSQMQAELNKPEARREIRSRMLTEKTVEKLVGHATSK
jgi:trigger factor